jgi:hypothetical protein
MYTSRAILAVSVFFVVGDAFRKKSSKTDAELEEGSFVEAEANKKAAERAQTLKDMKALAHKVVAGEEKIYDRTLKLLEKLKVVIDQAATEVLPQRKDQQSLLDDARTRFDSCIADYMTKTETIREKEGKRTGELEVDHNNTRSTEQQALDKKGRTCGDFQEYNAGLHPPPCALEFPPLCDWPTRSSCIDEIADWSKTHKAKYDPMKVSCQEAWQEHKKASKNAEDSQHDFEFSLCRWGVELHDACEYFEDFCWDKALTNRENVHTRIYSISEPALQAECIAIENIKCYLNVLHTTEGGMPAELKECVSKEKKRYVHECPLTNKYHDIPAKPDCLTVPAPCDEKWRQKTYVSQSWFEFTAGKQFCDVFPDGAEKVKTSECLEGCSIEPVLPKKCTASVYSDIKFTGNVATFGVGEYIHDKFVARGPLQNDKASSIKIQGPAGCKAILYGEDHFTGWTAEFPVGDYDNDKFLDRGAKNNQASSIKVILG